MTESPDIRHCISIMNKRFPFVLHDAFSSRDSSVIIPTELTEKYLVKLSRQMIFAIRMRDRKNAQVSKYPVLHKAHALITFNRLWKNLLYEAFYLQDIINSKDKKDQ